MNRIAIALFWLPFATALASAADLIVTVKDVRSATGAVFIAVYDRDTSFMKLPLAKTTRKENAAQGEVKFVVKDLPPGKYAVSSYHDENGNGKMDTTVCRRKATDSPTTRRVPPDLPSSLRPPSISRARATKPSSSL